MSMNDILKSEAKNIDPTDYCFVHKQKTRNYYFCTMSHDCCDHLIVSLSKEEQKDEFHALYFQCIKYEITSIAPNQDHEHYKLKFIFKLT